MEINTASLASIAPFRKCSKPISHFFRQMSFQMFQQSDSSDFQLRELIRSHSIFRRSHIFFSRRKGDGRE